MKLTVSLACVWKSPECLKIHDIAIKSNSWRKTILTGALIWVVTKTREFSDITKYLTCAMAACVNWIDVWFHASSGRRPFNIFLFAFSTFGGLFADTERTFYASDNGFNTEVKGILTKGALILAPTLEDPLIRAFLPNTAANYVEHSMHVLHALLLSPNIRNYIPVLTSSSRTDMAATIWPRATRSNRPVRPVGVARSNNGFSRNFFLYDSKYRTDAGKGLPSLPWRKHFAK